jgi:anti-anti-sigma factor
MRLALHLSQLDDTVLVRCEGRIVCGGETEELERQVRPWLRLPLNVILELSAVEFVDSSGLGTLTRLLSLARSSGADLKLAAPSPQVHKLLQRTCLARVFRVHGSPEEAVAAALRPDKTAAGTLPSGKRVLCVDESFDLLSFLRTVLQNVGYAATTTDNISDARLLLKASATHVVLIGPNLKQVTLQRATELLGADSPAAAVLALDADFHRLEAGAAAERLLQQLERMAA